MQLKYLKTQESFEKINEDFEGFWKSLIRIGEEVLSLREKEILKANRPNFSKNDRYLVKEKQIINEEYEQEIKDMLKKKNLKELQKLEQEIHEALEAKEFTMDIEYWDLILKKLDFYKAKIKLNDFYSNFKAKNVEKPQINPEKYQTNVKMIEENNEIGLNSPYLIENDEELEKMGLTIQEEDNLFDIQEERKRVLENEIEKALSTLRKNLKKNNKNEMNKNPPKITENNQEHEDQKNYSESISKMQLDEEINDRAVAEQIMNFERTKPLKPNEEKFDDLVEIKKVSFFLNIFYIVFFPLLHLM